jgi:hypothetical protein
MYDYKAKGENTQEPGILHLKTEIELIFELLWFLY